MVCMKVHSRKGSVGCDAEDSTCTAVEDLIGAICQRQLSDRTEGPNRRSRSIHYRSKIYGWAVGLKVVYYVVRGHLFYASTSYKSDRRCAKLNSRIMLISIRYHTNT